MCHAAGDDAAPGHRSVCAFRGRPLPPARARPPGVDYSEEGVAINELLQTSNPDVYALGDVVAGVGRFTRLG